MIYLEILSDLLFQIHLKQIKHPLFQMFLLCFFPWILQGNQITYAVPKLPYFFTYTKNNHLENVLIFQFKSIFIQSSVIEMAYAALHRQAISKPNFITYIFFKNKTSELTKIFLHFHCANMFCSIYFFIFCNSSHLCW